MSGTEATVRRRLCVAVDIQGYSGHSGGWQANAQQTLERALDQAAKACGLRRADWWRQESGDGELAVIEDDDGSREPVVIGRFPAALSDAVHAHSGAGGPRIRIAVHHGVTQRAAKGYSGDGVIEVCRIVDAAAVKEALDAAPGANLVLALSDRTFLDVVRKGYTGWRVDDFRRVAVRNKTYRGTVWLTVPGADPAEDRPGRSPEDEPEPDDAGPIPSVRQTANGHTVVMGGRDVHVGSLTTVDGDLYAPIQRRRRG